MKIKKILGFVFLAFTLLCVGTVGVLGIRNLSLDTTLENPDLLSQEEKIIVKELENLVDTLGNSVFPGFGEADIPTILYNSDYAFLVGTSNPADGWIKVPQGTARGTGWEQVAQENLLGQPYYRQPLPDPETTPEAFTVRIGDEWAASMQTYNWMKISMVEMIRKDLPGLIQPIFPYRIFSNQLVRGQDQYVTILAHERFHAYQGFLAEEKLSQAEFTNHQQEANYPWMDEQLEASWKDELTLLANALATEDQKSLEALARSFLAMREERREQASLTTELIAYEQQREWLEGLARYTELKIWELAAASGYTPLPDTSQLSEFNNYRKFNDRWQAELKQFTQMADDEGDGRFYYSGMAQAHLLDQLMPDWKTRAFDDNVWLEDLLAEAVQ